MEARRHLRQTQLMGWSFTSDTAEIPKAAEEWLLRDPVNNTIALTTLNRCRGGLWTDGAMFGWLTPDEDSDDSDVRGFVLHTGLNPLVLLDFPVEYVRPLAEALRTRKLPSVSGPADQVTAFADVWEQAPVRRMDERLYRLGTLSDPTASGRARRARPEDLDMLTEWFIAFVDEADAPGRDANPREHVRYRIEQGELMVWEDDGPVSVAGFSIPIAEMSRVGMVYTPPEHRRRGYGAAVTHAASQAALQAGATEVLLFTGLANPTSNSIYQALGYHPIADHATIFFA
ncbi:GNAT family N-acetyltransferase [Thermopolyspora sp. NPDC052614]|uniref:GNAT family N-acetyltransferase n=1 Tax=Thermopolyspora sp. NPDC052614 TaxID=3155682 RepID=UPI00343B5976